MMTMTQCYYCLTGSELDLNMMKYIHGKDWDAKLLEALISERIKPFIIKMAKRCK